MFNILTNREIKLIKNYFHNCSQASISRRYREFKQKYIQIVEKLINIIQQNPNYEDPKNILKCIALNTELKHCKECGKEMRFSQMRNNFCGAKCAGSNIQVQNKRPKFTQQQKRKISQKRKQTCLQKYGSQCPLQNKEIQQKSKYTLKEKYGVENIAKSQQIKLQKKRTCLQKYDYITPLINIKITKYSKKQKEVLQFIKSFYNGIIIQNDKTIIKPYQLDIVLPQLKLAIEFNGSYWHSIQKAHIQNYHFNKILKCNEQNYRLVNIWEFQWDKDKNIILNKLKDIILNKEIIPYEQKLNFSWYNNIHNKFDLFPPDIISINNFHIQNGGYIIIHNK